MFYYNTICYDFVDENLLIFYETIKLRTNPHMLLKKN